MFHPGSRSADSRRKGLGFQGCCCLLVLSLDPHAKETDATCSASRVVQPLEYGRFFFSFRASEGNCQSHHHAPYSISEKNTSIRDTTAAIHIPRQHNFPSHRARGRGLAWKNTTRRPSLVHRIGNMRLPGPAVSARELTSNHGWRADPVRAGPSTVTRTRTASTRHTVSAPLSLPLSPLAALPSPPPPS